MKKLNRNEKGFTIIEVVLVLAIAGLIFMVVFLALPGLQRSQKDTQRKQDVGRLAAAVTTYQGNNKGLLPTTSDTDRTSLLNMLTSGGSSFNDPSTGQPYDLILSNPTDNVTYADDNTQHMYLVLNDGGTGVECELGTGSDDKHLSENRIVKADTAGSSFAIMARMADGSVYCQQG
ncbi:MAG: type II secretion system GspH family protein [Candidatus Nomurabacteria bacterium]|jgi:prepilin-type N-terminal cleavage/methylation domain-containing protein|nr:type II secretion system GspH family protein [Candidatus Nomurabacteria bacterium]